MVYNTCYIKYGILFVISAKRSNNTSSVSVKRHYVQGNDCPTTTTTKITRIYINKNCLIIFKCD